MRFSESVLQTFMHSKMADLGSEFGRYVRQRQQIAADPAMAEKRRGGRGQAAIKRLQRKDFSADTAAVATASARRPWSAAAPAYARETIDVDTTGARVSRCRDAIRAEHNQHASSRV